MVQVASDEERERFQEVVLPYLADCYALARWLTGNRADAEDVVQDACLRALRGIGGFAGTNARAWTLTIVRNTGYSWLRKNRPGRAGRGRRPRSDRARPRRMSQTAAPKRRKRC